MNGNHYRLNMNKPREVTQPLDAGKDDATLPQSQRVNSATLFGPSRELIIEHAGREYRLRMTQNGKLILTA